MAKDDRVSAYLFLPRPGRTKKVSAVLCLHQTNGKLGSKEPAGLGGSPNLHYGLHLAELGHVVLVPDYPSFGEYQYDFQKSTFVSGTMKAIFNNMCAIDLLESLPEVDGRKIRLHWPFARRAQHHVHGRVRHAHQGPGVELRVQ